MLKRSTVITALLLVCAILSAQITSVNATSSTLSAQGTSQSETKGQRRKRVGRAILDAQLSRTHDKSKRIATVTVTLPGSSRLPSTPTTLSVEYDANNNVQAVVSDKGYRFEYNESIGI